jgi:hypothetical protein
LKAIKKNVESGNLSWRRAIDDEDSTDEEALQTEENIHNTQTAGKSSAKSELEGTQ